MRNAVAFACGLLFAVGLAVSGMTDPGKVIGFLDVGGAWDPSLALVMVGGIAIAAIAYRLRLGRPLLDARFPSLERSGITGRLVGGAALFGLGWGLVGYCPGPAIVSLGAATPGSMLFVASMCMGAALVQVSDL
jgi:uncharacterized membrane protein YedE/YeeE